MRKTILLIFSFQLLTYICGAQEQKGGNKVEVAKIAFMTKDLNLTSQEAQKFWPVYNGYTGELRNARNQYKDDELAYAESALNIGKKYQPEFKKVLVSEERVNKVFSSERRFREVLRKELQNRQKAPANKKNVQRQKLDS